ncbi:MAG: hypothetical protein ACYSVY_02485 [Planctomycetota bacterium]|jgi:hypothetical protein
MLLRVGGFVIILFWSASMTWLVWHDVWPALTAGDPPDVAGQISSDRSSWQVGIHNKYDMRIGTVWSTHERIAGRLEREDLIHLQSFPGLGRALITIVSRFTADGLLDEFDLTLRGMELPVEIKGERFASVYGFTITIGDLVKETFKVNADDAGLIGDALRPFASLPGLEVGQSWRMQVVNPIAVLTGFGPRFTPILVRVTGREPITAADGRSIACLVVEAPGVKAWTDEDGVVLVQQVELPVGGRITLRDEPYDEPAKEAARALFPLN